MMPAGHDADRLRRIILESFDMSLGTGLGKVKGRMFRIGHLGDMNEAHLCAALGGAEMAMLDCGIKVTPGSGVAAASSYLRENPLHKA